MKLETFTYRKDKWSVDPFPALDGENTLVLVFGAPEFRDKPEPIEALAKAYPNSTVVGCSTSGEIFDSLMYDDSLSVAVVQFEHTKVKHAEAQVSDARQSEAAGMHLANTLKADDLKGVIVLSEGITINGTHLIRGINSVLSDKVVVTGGLAGDGDRFEHTWVIKDGKPQSGWVAAVGLYGDKVEIGHGSKGGWDSFGPERKVTKSLYNVLYELDGQPALAVYEKYLGEKAAELPASGLLFPLAVRKTAGDDKRVVRTLLAVDRKEQSLTFAGDVETGHLVQLMKANFDKLVDGATEAANRAKLTSDSDQEQLVIAISCVGRRLVLGQRIDEELEATLKTLGDKTKQVGFYSYGEISPYTTGHCDLHNQTMTLTTIREG